MFEPTSRYYALDNVTLTMPDGRVITYKPRRRLPGSDTLQTLTEIEAKDGDRLDLITARTLGDPEQFWRVCDASDALNPFELVAEPGRRVRVPVPRN